MTVASKKTLLWILAVAGTGLMALAGWQVWTGTRASIGLSPSIESASIGTGDATSYKIAAHGRLSLALDALPANGPLRLVLDLPDAARGTGDRSARVVSASGQRIDTTAKALPGPGSGVSLEIDTRALSRGRYLIEVDTLDEPPLQLRRFVLELL